VQKVVLEELQLRRQKLFERLSNLKADSEEIWKSMETAEKTLADMVGCKDYDTTRFFVEEERASLQRDPEAILMKQRSDRKETEDFYLNVRAADHLNIVTLDPMKPFSEISGICSEFESNCSPSSQIRAHLLNSGR
jgi:hypothetical protein